MMKRVNRREFLKGGLASLGFMALDGLPVYAAGVGFGEGHEDNDGITLLDVPIENLPKGKKLTVAVRPVSSLGTKGKSIGTIWSA